MASTIKPSYAASATVAGFSLNSLATSSGLTAGYESDAIDNSSTLAEDYWISGKFKTGTSPTAGTIEVWVIPELEDSSWPDVFDGTGSTETATTRDILTACGALLWSVATDTTTGRVYYMRKSSVAQSLGLDFAPRKFVLFVTHNTVQNLDASAGGTVYQEAVNGQIV